MAQAATRPGVDPDRDLVAQAQAGDLDAFRRIVDQYQARVYRLALHMSGSQPDAEEITQETFLNLHRGLATFRGASSLSTWIYQVAANASLMRLRSARRKPVLHLSDLPPGLVNAIHRPMWGENGWIKQPDDQLLNEELRRKINQAVAALPEKFRLVFLLRDIEGLSNEEVAETLGLTLSTVKNRLHRARLILRASLDDHFARK